MSNHIHIDLNSLKNNILNESAVAQFAGELKYLFWHLSAPRLFQSDAVPSVNVTGKKADLEKFANVMGHEKKYMDAYLKHGLGDPKVLRDRVALEKAVFRFENDTGLKWPLK
jgi:hypothetical protein